MNSANDAHTRPDSVHEQKYQRGLAEVVRVVERIHVGVQITFSLLQIVKFSARLGLEIDSIEFPNELIEERCSEHHPPQLRRERKLIRSVNPVWLENPLSRTRPLFVPAFSQ